jgi:hypothetical protein
MFIFLESEKIVADIPTEGIEKLVISSQSSEIQEHFKNTPSKNFKRSGKRAVYIYGNYYHVEIEPSGRLLTFYPYENKAASEADTE